MSGEELFSSLPHRPIPQPPKCSCKGAGLRDQVIWAPVGYALTAVTLGESLPQAFPASGIQRHLVQLGFEKRLLLTRVPRQEQQGLREELSLRG